VERRFAEVQPVQPLTRIGQERKNVVALSLLPPKRMESTSYTWLEFLLRGDYKSATGLCVIFALLRRDCQ
jgi:hypothetical protein